MDSKLIEAAALRSRVHRMIERSEHDHVVTEWDKGFRYALARVERLIDKMPEAQRITMDGPVIGVAAGGPHGGVTVRK